MTRMTRFSAAWLAALLAVAPLSGSAPTIDRIQQLLGIADFRACVTAANLPNPHALPQFILIQDVHNHPEVQLHIASLILYGYRHWGARKVFVEGAISRVDLSVFHRIPEATRTALLHRMLRQGDLSGPEMAAELVGEVEWSNPPVSPFQLIGIEDPTLYRQNLEAYQDVQRRQKNALQKLELIRGLQNDVGIGRHTRLARQLDRTEDLVRLKVTPMEYAAFLHARNATPSVPEVDAAIGAAERFYRLVDLRSRTFLQQAAKKVPASAGPRIIVVGGFHTDAMAEQLRRENKTFVVLTPRVTRSGYEELYEKHLAQSILEVASSH